MVDNPICKCKFFNPNHVKHEIKIDEKTGDKKDVYYCDICKEEIDKSVLSMIP